MKNRKLWLAGIAAFVVAFAAAYAASPLLAANALRSAAQSGDAAKLSRLVDFPAVRESLKSQMNAMMMAKMTSDPEMKDNPFAGIAMAFMPAMIQGVVDAYVTPDNLSLMVKRGKAAPVGDNAQAHQEPQGKVDTRARYLDLNSFEYRVQGEGEPTSDSFALIFERRGLFSWKMVRLELPTSAMSETDRPS